nr:helix-turn-helix domain-containing protein [Psychrobacter pocilloporae]
MKINKAYKFRLEPNAEQQIILNNLLLCTLCLESNASDLI